MRTVILMINFLLGILVVNLYITYRYFSLTKPHPTPKVVLIFVLHLLFGFIFATESHLSLFVMFLMKNRDEKNE